MKRFTNFILYNNFFPLMFGIVFLGAGATFAASPEARDAIVSSETKITSVDNSYLIGVNLNGYDFDTYVVAITEDDLSYYVEYVVETIDIADGVWQPLERSETITIMKSAIAGQDLGVYVSKQLADIRKSEIARLNETKEIEKTLGASNKVVTTKYSGLIGRVLDPDNEVFPGYDAVVVAPPAIIDTTNPPTKKEEKTYVTVIDDEEITIEPAGGGEEPVVVATNTASSTTTTASSTDPVTPDPEPVTPTASSTEPEPIVEETPAPEPEPVVATTPEPEPEPEVIPPPEQPAL